MYVVGVVAPTDAAELELVERLVTVLGERGTVGTVRSLDPRSREDFADAAGVDRASSDAVETYGVTSEGDWIASGTSLDLDEALDRLAPRVDYAVVQGFPDASIPHVVVGDADAAGPLVASAPTADGLATAELADAVEAEDPHETLESLVARVKQSADGDLAGGIATFTGRVREKDNPDDDATEYLEFERYDEVAAERLATIREEIEARDGVFEVLLHHKTGVVEAGEDIVFVVVLAGHRTEAFRAVKDGIDRLKAEVPLFKKEVTVEDAVWAHER